MELADKDYNPVMSNAELGPWVEAEFAHLTLPAAWDPQRNRRRVNITQEGSFLEIDFCQEYLNPEPRWILRARINLLFDQQVAIITCLHVIPALRSQGVGRQLLARVENLVRQLQISRILIDTPTQAGWDFFKYLGYQELEFRSVMISHGQIYSVRLAKLLNA